jgi:serine/threonine protein phosphatase PrpC
MDLEVGAATARGLRGRNEDRLLVLRAEGLFAVADGIGGAPGGEIASQLAVSALRRSFQRSAPDGDPAHERTRLDLAFRLVRRDILAEARGVRARMGTTLAVLRLSGAHGTVGHVGDSRVYRQRAGRLEQLTSDHTLGHQGAASGAALRLELADLLTRALARRCDGRPDLRTVHVRAGDVFLLCSDGVSKPLAHAAMLRLLERPAEQAAPALVAGAMRAGGTDNATAVVVRVRALRTPPAVEPGGTG